MAFATLSHLFFWLRTLNHSYLLPASFYASVAVIAWWVEFGPGRVPVLLIFVSASLFIGYMIVLFQRKLKWRYREVLELAARA